MKNENLKKANLTESQSSIIEHLKYLKDLLQKTSYIHFFVSEYKSETKSEDIKQAKKLLSNQVYNDLIISIEEIEKIIYKLNEFIILKGGYKNG